MSEKLGVKSIAVLAADAEFAQTLGVGLVVCEAAGLNRLEQAIQGHALSLRRRSGAGFRLPGRFLRPGQARSNTQQ